MKPQKRDRAKRPAPTSAPKTRLLLTCLLLGVALLGGLGLLFWPKATRPRQREPARHRAPAALPPLTESSFLNTRAGVAYLGDQACAECHQEHCDSYHQHAMGRSMFAGASAAPLERFGKEVNNPFRAGQFHFQVERRGDSVVHREWCQDESGVVVAQQAAADGATPVRDYLVQGASPLLDAAVARDPVDLPALVARGYALLAAGRSEHALQSFDAALAIAPDHELSLTWAAEAAEA